jgi:LPS sulfotransferase NodH
MVFDPYTALNHARYDFPVFTGQPRISYIIAACHRSGSSWLGEALWETGVCGAPWEYFNELFNMRPLAVRFGSTSAAEYVEHLLRHRTSPNGVFGTKLQLPHWWPASELRRRLGRAVKVVCTTRRDKIAQGISLAKAMHSRQWNSFATAQPVEYDVTAIKTSIEMVLHQDRAWQQLLGADGAVPLSVEYEALEADFSGTVDEVRRYIGVHDDVADRVTLPGLVRQRDETNAEWYLRFTRDAADWLEAQGLS